jgi:hypothetical protein
LSSSIRGRYSKQKSLSGVAFGPHHAFSRLTMYVSSFPHQPAGDVFSSM